ncbi:MAG: hypothetical protein ABSG32_08730 [Terriglobia bacterium]
MKVTRRTFLSSGVGAAVAALPAYRLGAVAQSSAVRVSLVTGDRPRRLDVAQVFEELGLVVDLVEESGMTKMDPARASLLWIVGATYPDPMEISAANLTVIEKFLEAGKGVFVEFASNFPGVCPAGPIRRADVARLFVAETAPYPDALPLGAILDPHDAVLLPFEATETARAIVQIAKIAGVEKFDASIPPKNLMPGVLLGERGPGYFAVAATSISEFARRQYAPQSHWARLLQDLALTLLPADLRTRILADHIPLRTHTEPRRWATPGTAVRLVVETTTGVTLSLGTQSNSAWKETAPGRYETQLPAQVAGERKFNLRATRGRAARIATVELRVEDRKTAYRRALDNNLRWFEESGVLLRADGSLGVAEWISGPDLEGNRIPFGKRQGYSPERSDCVFESALAYWLYGKVAASDRHREVGRNMLLNVMDFQRLSVNDSFYGLWYTRGREGPVFQDDEAWAIMGSLAGYRYSRQPMLLHRGRLVADTAAKVFAKGAPREAEAADPARPRPSDRGQMIAAWLYAYGITGDRAFLTLALPALHELMESFPKIAGSLPAHTGESTRFMLPLALASVYSTDPAFPAVLREQADYLVSRMAPCGAIQEEGVYTGSKVQGGDLSLIHDSSEPISDQLYTMSFAAMNFWIAYKATGDEFYRANFFRVVDFLVRIQIESRDRTINGGWMRGFDYARWEYYGSNADQSWTAYCLETGWDNAIIDIAIELYLLDDTFYEARPPVAVGAEA